MFSDNLILFILYSKRSGSEYTFKDIKELLVEMYSAHMSLVDVMHFVLEAYTEFVQHGQFQIAHRQNSAKLIQDLMTAPFHWFHPDFKLDQCRDQNDVVHQLYNSYFKHIMGQFRLSNIGWCKEELGLDEGVIEISDELMTKAKKGLITKELKIRKANQEKNIAVFREKS